MQSEYVPQTCWGGSRRPGHPLPLDLVKSGKIFYAYTLLLPHVQAEEHQRIDTKIHLFLSALN